MLNSVLKTRFMKSQAQIFYQRILHTFCILPKVSAVRGVPEELGCHEIIFQAASQMLP